MKYTVSVEIALHREKAVQLVANPAQDFKAFAEQGKDVREAKR